MSKRVNGMFKYAQFKMFDEQINGGMTETCEVTYNGVPYRDLNRAMQLNIGLDIINNVCAHYGAYAPIIIDNAESVSAIADTKSQQIRFYVDEAHEELYFETV